MRIIALIVVLLGLALAQTAQRYAVVSGGVVTNVILWDGRSPYSPADPSRPGTEQLVLLPPGSPVSIGWTGTYNSSTRRWTFTAPPTPDPPEEGR